MPITTKAIEPGPCCFVVQDTIEEDGGLVSISIMAHKGHNLREEDLTTIASQREITVVSIVTAFTQYINTTVTNYSTLTSTVTTSSMKVSDMGQNPLKVPQQRVLRYPPHEVDRELSSGSEVVTAGITVYV